MAKEPEYNNLPAEELPPYQLYKRWQKATGYGSMDRFGSLPRAESLEAINKSKGRPGWHGDTQGHREAALKGQTDEILRTPMEKKERVKEFYLEEDKMGNITLTHPTEVDDAFFQLESDTYAIYDLLKPDEVEDLKNGYTVSIPVDEARASVFQELYEAAAGTRFDQRAEELGIDPKDLKLVEAAAGAELEEIEDNSGNSMDGRTFKFDGKSEYLVFEDINQAESYAVERVKNDLETEPSMFNQDWLQGFMSISDTDKRLLANDMADNEIESMDDEDIIKEAGMEDELEEINNKITEAEDRLNEAEDEDSDLELTDDQTESLQNEIKVLENQKDNLISKAKDNLSSTKSDEIQDALSDPVQYLVHDQGLYSEKDLFDQSFISIDTDEAAKDAVDTDGIAHFLATYDHDEHDLGNGWVMFRTG